MSQPSVDEQADAALKWWKSLGPYERDDGSKAPGDRATLAKLRRCSGVLEPWNERATSELFRKLGLTARNTDRLGRVAALASVLACVRDDNGKAKIAVAIGAPAQGDANEALLKPNRFKALVAARSDDEILTAFRRVVAILDRTANVKDLARLILAWNDDEAGDRARTRFAFDYHGAGFAAPADDATDTNQPGKAQTSKD